MLLPIKHPNTQSLNIHTLMDTIDLTDVGTESSHEHDPVRISMPRLAPAQAEARVRDRPYLRKSKYHFMLLGQLCSSNRFSIAPDHRFAGLPPMISP